MSGEWPEVESEQPSPAGLPTPIDWPLDAVVFGADVSADCLALTGSGKPCTYTAYRGNALCGTHQDTNDPPLVEHGHQWARIDDGDRTVAICVRCREVWANGTPATLVPCPTCEADIGERCWNDESVVGKSAPFPPHPERRKLGFSTVDDYWPCPENPFQDGGDDGA